jgi:oxalate---CoA ligase
LLARHGVKKTMATSTTLQDLLSAGQEQAPAIRAHNTAPLTYGAFRELVARTIERLNEFGIGRSDRVAIVLPNGPEMATAFVATASAATAAPLNPGYRHDEFEFYMSDIKTKALIVEEGSTSPAVAVAEELGICIITLTPDHANGAGAFTLSAETQLDKPSSGGPAQTDDIALILHTPARHRGPRSCR